MKMLNIRKLVLSWLLLGLCVTLCAQPAKKTRRTASNSKEAMTERQITSRFNQGLRAYYTAQYEEAMQTFSGILTDAPKHAPSYYMLSRVYMSQQRYTEAEDACRQAVKLDKNNIWYQVGLARICVNNGNYKSALPIWEKVCREFPDNPDFLSELAFCYEKTGDVSKAKLSRDRIALLSADDDGEKSRSSDAGSSGTDAKAKGIALMQEKDYAGAVAALEQALRVDDTDYDLWEAFALSVSKSGQWTRLAGLEEDMTTLFPQSATLLSYLAAAFQQTGQLEKAVEYYRQALVFSFDESLTKEIRKGLYDTYMRMGDTGSAERYR